MTREECKKYVYTLLGFPSVDLEIDELNFDNLIDFTLIEILPYVTDSRLKTIPAANVIDLSSLGIHASDVVNVYEVPDQSTSDIYGGAVEFSSQLIGLTGVSVDDYVTQLLTSRIRSQLTTDLEFRYEAPLLYLHYDKGGSVTIEYIPSDILSLINGVMRTYFLQLLVANTKETLGRIRGKMRVSDLPVEFDADTLLQESQMEKENVRQRLIDSTNVFFPE